MPTNENTYNSRVTSEALEKKFRDVFPSQAGAELVNDLYASGVIQPVVDFSSVAAGDVLPQQLQEAWDFSTGQSTNSGGGTVNAITNSGFWLLQPNITFVGTAAINASLVINDGATAKAFWDFDPVIGTTNVTEVINVPPLVVFLRAGDTLQTIGGPNTVIVLTYRQIADVNGNVVNPLGFTFT